MKLVMFIGGSLCFFGLIAGALIGDVLLLVAPGVLGIGVMRAYIRWEERRAGSWRAAYPKYRY